MVKNNMQKIKIEIFFLFFKSCSLSSISVLKLFFNSIMQSKQSKQFVRSVASEITVSFNFGFFGVDLDISNISQFALTDLLSHLRRSVTVHAFNQELQDAKKLEISNLEIDEIVSIPDSSSSTRISEENVYSFKITFKVFHKSSSVSSSSFEDVDDITTRMFTKISQTTFTPEFECLPHYIKPTFHASCTRQHVCGIMAI
jgi:hypothetical protein